MSTVYDLLAVKGIETTTPRFREQLVAGALSLGLNPSYLAAIISLESGFNPAIQNQLGAPALGLIQFWEAFFPDIAKRAGRPDVSWNDLRYMTAEEQLPFVIAYYAVSPLRRRTGATPTDYYMSNFLPAFVGYDKGKILGVKGSTEPLLFTHGGSSGLSLGKVYSQNPGFDSEKKGYFTVGDVGKKIEGIVSAARGRASIPVPLDRGSPPSSEVGVRVTSTPPGKSDSSSPRSSAPVTGSSPTVRAPLVRAPAAADLPTLRRGDHGTAVRLLQQLLALTVTSDQDPNDAISVDGEFGDETDFHLALHQNSRGLKPDGVCGPATWKTFWQNETWELGKGLGRLFFDEDKTEPGKLT